MKLISNWQIKTLSYGQSALQRVAFARNYLDKQILNICFDIGNLSSDVMLELGTTSNTLKLSADNLIKNFITHSDVCFDDYCKIPQIAQNPTKFTKSKNGLDIILFKKQEKYYKLVIKTTKNKNENYVKSFHLIQKKKYDKY